MTSKAPNEPTNNNKATLLPPVPMSQMLGAQKSGASLDDLMVEFRRLHASMETINEQNRQLLERIDQLNEKIGDLQENGFKKRKRVFIGPL